MKILMDLVAIQSEGSRGRGIGRYSEELSKHIIKNIKNKEVYLLLNGLYPEHDKSVKEYFKDCISSNNFIKYHLLNLNNKPFDQRVKYSKLNNILLSKQLNNIEGTEIIHFHSVFEGLGGKADIINNFLNLQSKTVVTLYDLIPLIYQDIYLSDLNARDWYYKVLRLFYEADLVLSISDATKEDAINILGIPESKIINISGAIDNDKFYKLDSKQEHKEILNKYSITQEFVMYTGGVDFRKNIESSIKAFAKIEKQLLQNHQFVIVCKITQEQKESFESLVKTLNIPQDKIIFTGFVSDEELNILYNYAKLFIFPSIYEGFGLPILEAMSCGTAVIGSNSSSIPEIIANDKLLFNPTDIDDIKNKINLCLGDEKLLEELQNYSYKRSKQFSWDNSALKAIEGYKSLENKSKQKIEKQKIAFFSPFPNQRSGISDYSLELLPFLSKYVTIDIFIDDYEIDSQYIKSNYNINNYKQFEALASNYDTIIYQFGNSSFHSYMYDIALKHKGIVVLHDFYLSGLVDYIAYKNNDNNFLFDNLVYSHNIQGEKYVQNIQNQTMSTDEIVKRVPINKQIIDSATSVIVHSEYAKNLFSEFYSDDYNIQKIDQLIKIPSKKLISDKTHYKEKLGFKKEEIIISAFGHISYSKQYDFILESFVKADIFKNKNIKLLFIGEFSAPAYQEQINEIIEKNNLNKKVIITGFVSDEQYKHYSIATDIAINLRIDSRGETSRALLMNMAYGLPTIINNYASFSEIPDQVSSKVILNSQEDFIEKLNTLIENKSLREEISQKAYNYICSNHSLDTIAKEYYDIISATTTDMKKENSTIKDIANIIHQNSLDSYLSGEEYNSLANILKQNIK